MSDWLANIIAALSGAVVGGLGGFIGAWKLESWRFNREKNSQGERFNKLLAGLLAEMRIGSGRCSKIFSKCQAVGEEPDGQGVYRTIMSFSASRVYTGYWDTVKTEIVDQINDVGDLEKILACYHVFDLVNYNMERVALAEKGMAGKAAVAAKAHASHFREIYEVVNLLAEKYSVNLDDKLDPMVADILDLKEV